MEQLKMYRKSAPVKEFKIPEGFSVRKFNKNNYQADVEIWLDICKEGILGQDSNEKTFVECCVDYPDANPENIIFLEYNSEAVATVFAIVHKEKHGYVHMVCCKEKCRGMGVGKALNGLVLTELEDAGCVDSYLTTDDFRIGAIKGYLENGFVPVMYDTDMRERWSKVLDELKIDNVSVVDENYKDIGMLR